MIDELMRHKNLRQVWATLTDHPETRDSDRILFDMFYKNYYKHYDRLDKRIPTEAQVSKWRHKIQTEIDRELTPSTEVAERRKKASKYYANGAI